MTEHEILRLADTFAAHRGLKRSTVSTYVAADGKWLEGLNRGASCTFRKASRVLHWFSDNWPRDLEWPRDIPRPPKSKEAA